MKTLRCEDVTKESCDYVAEGDSSEDVKDDLLDHCAQEHRSMWDIMPKRERAKMTKHMDELLKKAEEVEE